MDQTRLNPQLNSLGVSFFNAGRSKRYINGMRLIEKILVEDIQKTPESYREFLMKDSPIESLRGMWIFKQTYTHE